MIIPPSVYDNSTYSNNARGKNAAKFKDGGGLVVKPRLRGLRKGTHTNPAYPKGPLAGWWGRIIIKQRKREREREQLARKGTVPPPPPSARTRRAGWI
ncbi:hypothetical protein AVEN_33011-1 [Araneus ventricosus]|uniref:Uncharacterized protein n=1 Tax=Araneus ventricosus TaxID=182803 RepID=A0A4Y2LSS7_ARAVE|nr:hypothetical protein AVEN_33011-1 [Araneus ventricosus]